MRNWDKLYIIGFLSFFVYAIGVVEWERWAGITDIFQQFFSIFPRHTDVSFLFLMLSIICLCLDELMWKFQIFFVMLIKVYAIVLQIRGGVRIKT